MTTQTTAPLPEPPATRRLTRSSTDRVIAGVAGGLGRYFNIDPVIVRLALIVLAVLGGAGFVLYLAAWLIVPADGPNASSAGPGYVLRRIGMLIGVLALTLVAVIGGFAGFAGGSAVATAIVVISIGAVLALAAFAGGVRWLIVPALAFALTAGAAAAPDQDIRGGTGERIYRPLDAAALRSDYRLGMGHLRVDLRHTQLGPGEHRLHLKLGVGEAEVLVPPTVCVSTDARVAGGATAIFDQTGGGTYHDTQDVHRAARGAPHLTVDADVGFGLVRIEAGPTTDGAQEGPCVNG